MQEVGTTTPPPDTPNLDTIVVMESDVLARMVITEYLRECRYKVVEAATADDVMLLLGSGLGIGTVFLGAQSPDGTEGFSLAHRIRVANPEIEVILTSGVENAAAKAAEVCSNGNLTKTYNPKEVVRRIHLLRERHRTSK